MTERGRLLVPDWPAPPNVRAVVTTRFAAPAHRVRRSIRSISASRCGDSPAAVAANRAALISALALPESPRWLRQVHGTDVLDADATGSAGQRTRSRCRGRAWRWRRARDPDRRLPADPVLRRRRHGDRGRACRLARACRRRDRGDDRAARCARFAPARLARPGDRRRFLRSRRRGARGVRRCRPQRRTMRSRGRGPDIGAAIFMRSHTSVSLPRASRACTAAVSTPSPMRVSIRTGASAIPGGSRA